MSVAARPDPWPGRVLRERYRVGDKLADGGMGSVYRGEDVSTGRPVALKILHAHLAQDADMVERFRREALAASAIGDPRIIDVLSLADLADDGSVFMAMELLEGRDLGQVLKEDGPLGVGRAVSIVRHVAGALSGAHDKGIVHRDLKPENIFLTERDGDPDVVKVLDFGISKLLEAIDGVEQPAATKTGTTLGTPHYMAPEQAQAKKGIDHRVDVYAMGVVLFRVLTGQYPFDDDALHVLIVKICADPPPSLRSFREDVPGPLDAVLQRAMAKRPEDRFQSMEAFRAALAPFEGNRSEPRLIAGVSTREQQSEALRQPSEGELARTIADRRSEPPAPPPGGSGGAAKLALACMGIVLIAMIGWVVAEQFDDPAAVTEPPLPTLPEPEPPQTNAMVAMGGGVGWTWVNPRPRAMPTWYATDSASDGDRAVFVGWRGAAVRFEAGSLYAWSTGTDRELRGVAWTGAHEALAAGAEGTLVRLRQGARTRLDSGTDVTLRAVVAPSPTEALVVGDAGTVLRVVGERVTRLDLGIDADLVDAHAAGSVVFAVGSGGTVLRIEGREVANETVGVSSTLRAIGGCPRGEIYAAGDQGVLLRRRVTGTWSRLRVSGNEAFTAVSCDHGRVAAARADGEVLLVSGPDTVRLPTGFEEAWHGLSGGERGPTWMVGSGGRLATIEGAHVRTRTAGPTVPLRAMGAMGGALVAVGEWGRILRQRRSGIERVESPTDSGLAGLIQMSEGRLLAVGDFGAMVDIRHDRATLISTPSPLSLRDGVSDGDELLVVGAGGTMLRGTPGLMTESRVPDVGDLWAAAGRPAQAVVVGDDGVVLRVLSNGFSRVECDTEASLRDVALIDGVVWAVGQGGVVVRVEGDACEVVRNEGPDLHAVGHGPDGRVMIAGDEALALLRTETGWESAGVDLAGTSIRVIWRNSRHVYLAGTGGAIARHIRLDGR
ncbi:MAG: protein kinase [Sandaracinaceae bacterium]